MVIEGRLRHLYRRRFCLTCSPFGVHNTSKVPPQLASSPELVEYRRRKRNAKTYRWQKRHRLSRKAQLVLERGGRCVDCGYSGSLNALDFHHRDPSSKEFGLGRFTGSLARYRTEAEKCDLVCTNCHRLRHLAGDPPPHNLAVAETRMQLKRRAVLYMGGACFGCGRSGPQVLFDFHHWDARTKEFGISEDGILRRWASIVAELAKCVMLCANCHREVHAGVRELDEGLLGLAEDALPYVA
jgi:ribosomal protein L44E